LRSKNNPNNSKSIDFPSSEKIREIKGRGEKNAYHHDENKFINQIFNSKAGIDQKSDEQNQRYNKIQIS
jgi:hypothetical protein